MTVLVECFADEALVRALGVGRREILHAGDRGRVCNKMRKGSRLTGLVDEDPGGPTPGYLDELALIEESGDMRVLEDKSRGNKLIVLRPRLEEWILEAAREADLDWNALGLASSPSLFRKMIATRPGRIAEVVRSIGGKSRRLSKLERQIG